MSYYQFLRDELDQLMRWAELRREQGAAPDKRLERLSKLLRRTTRRLEHARPARRISRHEPNTLREIKKLRPDGPRKIWTKLDPLQYMDKVKGAYLARAAGCTLGAIVEGWPIDAMKEMAAFSKIDFPPADYWPIAANPHTRRYSLSRCQDYTAGAMKHVPVDDDVTYTLLGLLILEDFGPDFTTRQVGQAWLKYLPFACTAEDVALKNLKSGVTWKKCGQKNNPYQEWIGADIRSDPWGYGAPGWPEKAAQLAFRDAYISHRNNGIYGEMYFAATISAAFAVADPLDACRIGLSEIPARCRLAADVRWALSKAPKIKDYLHARKLVDERFGAMSHVHTNNNACLTIFGLALGGLDVTRVIGNTVAMGMDNDCTAATAGSIVGAVVGGAKVPAHWYKPFSNKTRTYITGNEWFRNDQVVQRFATAAQKVWA
jgi:ADP-ribosylglycohydrolase